MAMRDSKRSRREFMAAAAAAVVSARVGRLHGAELTAEDAIARIRSAVGVPWRETTVDTIKAGDPDWLRTFLADLPIDFVPAGEPFA